MKDKLNKMTETDIERLNNIVEDTYKRIGGSSEIYKRIGGMTADITEGQVIEHVLDYIEYAIDEKLNSE